LALILAILVLLARSFHTVWAVVRRFVLLFSVLKEQYLS
jgi:hypothetical protein